jgi:hypothetical protein
MPTYSFTYDQKLIDDIINDLENAPRSMQQAISTTIKAQVERDIQPLRDEPPQPDYPFIWSHDPQKQARARAWWFAHLKRTGNKSGGRYDRTHGLSQGWEVDVSQFRASILIAISNAAERAVKWVQSVFQVPSHKRSGWVQYEGVVLKAEERAADSIIDIWYLVVTGQYR